MCMRITILFPRAHDASGLWQGSRAIHGLPVKSGKSDWLRIRNEYSAHTQKIGSCQSSLSLPQARRIVGSGDENGVLQNCRRAWKVSPDSMISRATKSRTNEHTVRGRSTLKEFASVLGTGRSVSLTTGQFMSERFE